jgi:hypothetical protein
MLQAGAAGATTIVAPAGNVVTSSRLSSAGAGVSAPAAGLSVSQTAPVARTTYAPPAAGIAVHVSIPSVAFAAALIQRPAENEVVPSDLPWLSISTRAPGATGEVTVKIFMTADLAGAWSATTVPAASSDGGQRLTNVQPGFSMPDGPVYTYVQVFVDGEAYGLPSPIRTFIVATTLAVNVANGSLTIDAAATASGHLWFVFPASGQAGDTVTLYGQGLFNTTAQVQFAGIWSAESANHIAASTDAYTPNRVIDPAGIVSVEHDEVGFIIPDAAAPPGGQIAVVET